MTDANKPQSGSAPKAPAGTGSKMDKIVALCRRRGFVWQSSEIYGGINGFWDYGPLGVELKRNLKDAWWHDIVRCPPPGPDGRSIEWLSDLSSDLERLAKPAVVVPLGMIRDESRDRKLLEKHELGTGLGGLPRPVGDFLEVVRELTGLRVHGDGGDPRMIQHEGNPNKYALSGTLCNACVHCLGWPSGRRGHATFDQSSSMMARVAQNQKQVRGLGCLRSRDESHTV